MIASAGNSTICGESKRWERASLSMFPQLAAGGGTPRPRKLSVASASTTPAMPMAACTMSGCRIFGRMCRVKMRKSEAPSARAASTNSFSLTASTCARTRRAYPTHPPIESASTRFRIPGPRKATKAIASRMPGKSEEGIHDEDVEGYVEYPAIKSGNAAERQPQSQRTTHNGNGHEERDSRAKDHPRQNIAA
jgi:hypothetical protein